MKREARNWPITYDELEPYYTRRAHEVDNLYVVDTSFFPSIGAVNPALTAMANAVRVGDHLLERLGARRPRSEVAHVA